MKKLLLLLCSVFFFLQSEASHLMGGEIVVHVDSNNVAHFILTVYRDDYGVAMPSQTVLTLHSNPSNSVNVPMVSTSSTLLSGSYVVEKKVFTGSYQLNAGGKYHVSWSTCCRNGSIQNMTNPSAQALYIFTEFTAYAGHSSSTPFFLNDPILTMPKDTLWTYNPNPFDMDGDSLHWMLDTSYSAFHTPISGHVHPPSNPNGIITMDPVTGQISWSASSIGNYQLSILVEEYRNGMQIGEIRRDMQIIVVNDTSQMKITSGGSNVTASPIASLPVNSSFSYTIDVSTTDPGDSLSMIATGEPLLKTGSNATFITSSSAAGQMSGTFSWTPTAADRRNKPYIVSLMISDGEFAYSVSLRLQITSGVNLDDGQNISEELHIYPVPAIDYIKVKAPIGSEGIYTIYIQDINGKLVRKISDVDLRSDQALQLELNLQNGNYIILAESDKMSFQKKFSLSK